MNCHDVTTDLGLDEAYAIIEPYFLAVRSQYLEAGLAAVRRTTLRVDPTQHDTARHFAACRDDGRLIQVAPELAELGYETALGILAHEFGHAADFLYPAEFVLGHEAIVRRDRKSETDKQWRKFLNAWKRRDDDTVEFTADAIAESVLGVPIGYRGPCMLQAIGAAELRPVGLR